MEKGAHLVLDNSNKSQQTKTENNAQETTKESKVQLSTTEISSLWTTYMQMSMSQKMLEFFERTCEDNEVKEIISNTLKITYEIKDGTTKHFKDGNVAVPYGFADDDVNLSAPKLFTEHYMLFYMQHMMSVGLIKFAHDKATATRDDILNFFTVCIKKTDSVFDTVVKAIANKGLTYRFPLVNIPKKPEFPTSRKYMSNYFRAKRPLNIMEITQLRTSIDTNSIGQALLLAFAQTAQSEKIRKYMVRGKDIARKHGEIFTGLLTKEDINVPNTLGNAVTDSITSPFTDRLMLYHVIFLNSIGLNNYGRALGTVTRKDVLTDYSRLMAEIADYAEDGMSLMLEYGWFEQPPQPISRKELIGV